MGDSLPVIYVAGPWKRRDEVKAARDKFTAAGFPVTSQWLDVKVEVGADGYTSPPEVMRKEAMRDIGCVLEANIIVVMNLEMSEGKAVELGVAIASCKGVVIVGERTNVFHYLDFPCVPTVEEAIELCKNYPWKPGQEVIAGDN